MVTTLTHLRKSGAATADIHSHICVWQGDEEDEELESKFQTNAFTMLSLMGDAEVDVRQSRSHLKPSRAGDNGVLIG